MALSAADVRFAYILVGFDTEGLNLDLLGQKREGPFQGGFQLQVFTGICPENARYRTIKTKFRLPGKRGN